MPVKQHAAATIGKLIPRFPQELTHTGVAGTWVSPLALCAASLALAVLVACLSAASAIFADAGDDPGDLRRPLVLVNIGGAALAGVISRTWRWASHYRLSALELRQSQFRSRAIAAHTPTETEPGPGRGVAFGKILEFSRDFEEFIQDRHFYYVVDSIIKPLTEPYRLSAADLVAPEAARFFAGCFWGTPFRSAVTSLSHHASLWDSDPCAVPYWLGIFSVNQWKVAEELGTGIVDSSLARALLSSECQGYCMVLDEEASSLTRAWCWLECSHAVRRWAYEPAFSVSFATCAGVLGQDDCSYDMHTRVAARLEGRKLRGATASSKDDLVMIKEFIDWDEDRLERAVFGRLQEAIDRRCRYEASFQREQRGQRAAVQLVQEEAELSPEERQARSAAERKRRSERAGVGVAYLLSEEFLALAQEWSGKEDPTFYDLKEAFWLRSEKLGSGQACPRDGRPGCALVDLLAEEYRGEATHFLSWSWAYSVSQVRSALELWARQDRIDPKTSFLYMCFFVNNQHRIIVEESSAGSDNLEELFETNLRRINNMVALLDTWDQPIYLTRIWTIFEQFMAIKVGIKVRMILPQAAQEGLMEEIGKGSSGIARVCGSLSNVDSEQAVAFSKKDEEKVKSMIRSSDGSFEGVDEEVQAFMLDWVGQSVRDHLSAVIDGMKRQPLARRSSTLLGDSRRTFTM